MNNIVKFFSDLRTLITAIRTKPIQSEQIMSIGLMVQNNALRYPEEIALICEEESVTWKQFNHRSNRIARILHNDGIKKGDCVSLVMQNRIEFLVCLVGIQKIGGIAGLINTNLTKAPLIHCINLIESKKCIFGEEQLQTISEVIEDLSLTAGSDYIFIKDNGEASCPSWANEANSNNEQISLDNLPETSLIQAGDRCSYIFTSGTTGLPKAAVVSYKRCIAMGISSAHLIQKLVQTDRMYNCLPLYHATGLNMGWLATVEVGASMVIRRKLSVSAFWDDIRKYDCTSFVYIGEFIRYLMTRPPKDNDKDHAINKTIGNGLRPDIWLAFKERFGISHIGEFYGASEGNSGFGNIFNKDCTVGTGVVPLALIQYNVADDKIVRDETGACIPVQPGEPGLLVIKVTDKTKFEGYTNKEASEKKILADVLEPGDSYFNSGDLLKEIKVGFAFGMKHYQFVDRVGDTFRWKGENVSTNEVGEVINQYPDVHISNVYGVDVPNTDGKAGMAALILNEKIRSASDLDLVSLSIHISSNLPHYANPVFLRLLDEQPTTATMKLQKNVLREQAYHIDKTDDVILVLKPKSSTYQVLEKEFYDEIIAGQALY
ncbi:MAG: citronellyl-CoA synthetase [Gammaproteobacteria bacterium]|jgi:citronellyl-CoA synthetase